MANRVFPRVGVLGFGIMGSGIAQVFARSGRHVTVLETDQSRLDAGFARVREFLDNGIRRGKVSAEEGDEIVGRINGVTELANLADMDLVVEAISEDRALKTMLLRDVAEVVDEKVVIATNTSALSVTELATVVPSPRRVAGLHFFNPPQLMALVEVVGALQSSEEVLGQLCRLVEELGKEPARVKDRPGFLINALLMPYLNDVVDAYDKGLASAEDIDTALELGLGYKIGPLKLLDIIGLDTHHHATLSAYERTFDERYAPPPLLSQMVAAGYLGRKSGRGFRYGADNGGEA